MNGREKQQQTLNINNAVVRIEYFYTKVCKERIRNYLRSIQEFYRVKFCLTAFLSENYYRSQSLPWLSRDHYMSMLRFNIHGVLMPKYRLH